MARSSRPLAWMVIALLALALGAGLLTAGCGSASSATADPGTVVDRGSAGAAKAGSPAENGSLTAGASGMTVLGATSVAAANTITVTGDGTVQAAPDEAIITLTVENDAADPGTALDNNSKSMQKVLSRLKAEGVEDSAIRTANVSVYPNRTYDPQSGKESLVGYRAQNSVTVTLKNAALVGKILAASVETGATTISGPVWQLSEDNAAQAEALKKAVDSAKTKVQAIADAAGVQVGDVIMMNEGGVQVPVVPIYTAAAGMGSADSAKAVDAPVSPGTLDVTATVTVSFALVR